MKYTVRGNRNKGFTITDENDAVLGRIAYHNWFSRKASVSLYNNDTYEIVPSGFWQVAFDIIKAEYKTGSITVNWRGNMIINLNGNSYIYKRTGFWQKAFVLKTGAGSVATARQQYEWSKMGYLYEIDLEDNTRDPDTILLLLLMIYCTNQQYAGAGAV